MVIEWILYLCLQGHTTCSAGAKPPFFATKEECEAAPMRIEPPEQMQYHWVDRFCRPIQTRAAEGRPR